MFGRVVEGLDVLKIVEMVATDNSDRPKTVVTIADCGQLGLEEDLRAQIAQPSPTTGSKAEISAASKSSPSSADEGLHDFTEVTQAVVDKEEEEVEEVEEQLDKEALEVQMEGMSAVQRRLFLIRMKINQGRKANKSETEAEFHRFSDPKYDAKQRFKEKQIEEQKALHKKASQHTEGSSAASYEGEVGAGFKRDKEDSLLQITAEAAERIKQKQEEKDKRASTFGWHAFTAEADFNAYKKQLSKLPSSTGVKSGGGGASVSEFDELSYGRAGAAVTTTGVERLSQSIKEREQERAKHSRRRMALEGADVDYINDKNAVFNKKIKRSFDKYTVEIRQNLERGTAI